MSEQRIPPAGDPFYAASRRNPHHECVEAIQEEEDRRGRPMAHGERVAFAYGFFAPSYRAELSRLAALGVELPDEEEG